jgi:predicted nucleic-acid-binding Zn-ribbon protein
MPTNEEIINRIISALQEKVGNHQIVCPICGNQSWTVNNRYVVLTLSEYPTQIALGGEIMPLIPMNCTKCGNTHLLNILVLGFKKEDFESLRFSKNV